MNVIILVTGKADPVGRLVMSTQREVDGDPESTYSTCSDSIHPDVTMDYIKFFEAPDKLTNVTELTIGECTGEQYCTKWYLNSLVCSCALAHKASVSHVPT